MTDPRALVLSRTALSCPPLVPELRLHLADDMDAAWAGLQAELDDGDLPPPFWAFAWLGGQAVARHVLDDPDVRSRRQVQVTLPLGDTEILDRLRERGVLTTFRAAGSTCLVEADLPGGR